MSVPSPKENPSSPPVDVQVDDVAPRPTRKSGETDPLIGRVISDRFRILSPIARGGMGVVYKAEQAPLGRLVAIKILSLKQDEEKDPEFRRRFFLEAATVAKLTHPNTVTVFDYGQGDGGVYYIAMELVNGRTLKKALNQEGPFPPSRAANIVKQICRSLREAHRLGVIHRDMKPGNVMLVDRDGEDYVKVLDFGLVKEMNPENPDEDLTQAGVFMGSPKYMAPEQIQGENVDGRSDIYAIGVMLYEMLTGRVPFNRENPMQILMDHVREPVPPMTVPAGTAAIPPELQAVVFKCLEKKKEDRYADMEALLVAIRTGGEGTPLSSSSTSREIDLGMSSAGTPVSGVHTVGPQSPPAGMPSGALPALISHAEESAPRSKAPLFVALLAGVGLVAGIAIWAMSGNTELTGVRDDGASVRDTPSVGALPPGDRVVEGPVGGEPTTEAALGEPATVEPGTVEPGTVEPGTVEPGTLAVAPGEPTEAPVHTLMLSLRSFPVGATVHIGDREYGPTPTQVEIVGALAEQGTHLEMTFERGGYRSTTLTETVTGPTLEVNARLIAIRRGGTGPSTGTGEAGETHVEGYRDSPY